MNTITELIEAGKIITPEQWNKMRTVCADLAEVFADEPNVWIEWDAMVDDCDSDVKLADRRDLDDEEKEEIAQKLLDKGMNPERFRFGYIYVSYPKRLAKQPGWNDEYTIVTTVRDQFPCDQSCEPDPDFPSQSFTFAIYG